MLARADDKSAERSETKSVTDHRLVNVAPAPVLARLEGLDDRVSGVA